MTLHSKHVWALNVTGCGGIEFLSHYILVQIHPPAYYDSLAQPQSRRIPEDKQLILYAQVKAKIYTPSFQLFRMDSVKAALPFVVASIAGLIIFFPAVLRYLVVRYRLRNFKGPRGLPIIGNVLQFGPDNVSFLKAFMENAEIYRENGSFLVYFGFTPIVVVYNAVDLERILRNVKHDEKGYFYKLSAPWLKDGLLLSKGSKWITRRKLLTPSFHFSILKKFLVILNEQAQCLTDKICESEDKPSVNLPSLLSLCSLDIMCETIMGRRLGAQSGESCEYVEALHRIGAIINERSRKPWYNNNFIYGLSPLGKKQDECLKILHGTTKQVINDRNFEIQIEGSRDVTIDDKSREVRKRRRLAFLDLLIEVQKQDPSFTDEGIQEEVDTFMFEGHDTVAASLTMALYLIGRHPKVQAKVQEELERVFGDDRERFVTSDNLQELEYLSCVMKESQRLLTPVPFVGRDLAEDTRIGGIEIPKGTNILMSLIMLHRDPKQFPEPEKFDPDRFLPANSEGRHNFAYLPFSAGHRNCIGQKFAVMEQKVILATVLRKFEISSLQTLDELKLSSELVLRAVDGVQVKFTQRP
ncbi:Cytochrome P450 4V2 [Holothuria leucospilota]|uniref:Cytochrome P450 4V2 n=1 Tax=Holothuria leucospilota TaxID=206669 RepID=A0A9Q1C8Q4_HOLLE|nr:Cytochrome P450 4V2 [Holothuria leucospilota]